MNPDCAFICAERYPPGPEFDLALDCVRDKCAVPCGLGRSFDCQGLYHWSKAIECKPTFQYTMSVVAFYGGQPITGAVVKACGALDPACLSDFANQTTLADGKVSLTLNAPFDGFILVSADGYVPQATYLERSIVTDTEYLVKLVKPAELDALVSFIDSTRSWDPSKALLYVALDDCSATRAPGISFTVPQATSETLQGYYSKGYPRLDLTETTSSGDGAFVDLPPGLVDIIASHANGGAEISRENVFATAGTVTWVVMFPDTAP
jgi:hypothetical protein